MPKPDSPRLFALTLRCLAIAALALSIGAGITGALPDGVAIFADRNDCFLSGHDCTKDLVLVDHERAATTDQLPMLVVMVLGALIVALRPRVATVMLWFGGATAGSVLALRHGISIDFRDTRELWPAQAFWGLGYAAMACLALAVVIALGAAIARVRARPVSHAVVAPPAA